MYTSTWGKSVAILLVMLLLAQPLSVCSQTALTLSKAKKPFSRKSKIAPDLEALLQDQDSTNGQKIRVIIQPDDFAGSAVVSNKLARLSAREQQTYNSLQLVSAELPVERLRELAADEAIAYISPDREVFPAGSLEATTGAAQVRSLVAGTTLNGQGVGIAIIDSGVFTGHSAFTKSRFAFSKDFTGGNRLSEDSYGHGSHMATLVGGSADFEEGSYTGIAPGSRMLNLRVLDDNGRGSTRNIIAALDWCIANRTTYNLRIINMSLGTPAKDSYRNDPLCLAARRAHDADLIVVCSAGNVGKDKEGRKLYGGIQSPGIDPSVITVGASNTFNTNKRSDDVVTTYSSRGPTRGYWTDAQGMRHYDNLIKPDLVAPGNRLIGAQSISGISGRPNRLVQLYPALNTQIAANKWGRTMYLSGTSVAAPLVAGTAALMLQANPTLTPNLVKAILMYTAQPLSGFNTLEQGAGQLNVDGAVKLARLVRSNAALLANGAPLLTSPLPNAPTSKITGETFVWGQGVITDYCFLYGSDLINYWQGMYSLSTVLSDATAIINGEIRRDLTLLSSGVLNSEGAVQTTGIVLADGRLMASGIVLADGSLIASGVVFADGVVIPDGIVLADDTPQSDYAQQADAIIYGEGASKGK